MSTLLCLYLAPGGVGYFYIFFILSVFLPPRGELSPENIYLLGNIPELLPLPTSAFVIFHSGANRSTIPVRFTFCSPSLLSTAAITLLGHSTLALSREKDAYIVYCARPPYRPFSLATPYQFGFLSFGGFPHAHSFFHLCFSLNTPHTLHSVSPAHLPLGARAGGGAAHCESHLPRN